MTSTIEDRAQEEAVSTIRDVLTGGPFQAGTDRNLMDALADSFTSRLTTFAKDEVEKALEEAYRLGHERIDRLRERMARTGYRVGLSDICAVLSHIRALKEGDKP